jgi:hypothetical protein
MTPERIAELRRELEWRRDMAGSSEREQLSGKIAADLLAVLDDYEKQKGWVEKLQKSHSILEEMWRKAEAELERALAENKKLRLDVDGEPSVTTLDYRERRGK